MTNTNAESIRDFIFKCLTDVKQTQVVTNPKT